jgi:hypothetical protein
MRKSVPSELANTISGFPAAPITWWWIVAPLIFAKSTRLSSVLASSMDSLVR